MTTSYADLAQLLSDGLNLAVRARKLDDIAAQAVVVSEMTGTHCATAAVWVLDQYDTDLADWEKRSRAALLQLSEPSPPPAP